MWSKRSDILRAAFLVVLAGFFAYWVYFVIKWAGYPYQFEYSEGFNLWVAQHIWSWNWHINGPPYIPLFYPQLSFIIINLWQHLVGGGYATARIVSVASTLSCVTACAVIAWHYTKDKYTTAVAFLLPLALPVVRGWSVVAREDLIGIQFELWGFYLAVKYFKDSRIYWSIPLFVLAIWCKQITLLAWASVGVVLISQNWKRGVAFALVSIAAVVLPFGVVDLFTKGQFIYQLFVVNGSTTPFFINAGFLNIEHGILAQVVGLVVIILCYQSFRFKKEPVILVYAVVSVVGGFVLLSMGGGYINRTLESAFAVSIGIALCIYWIRGAKSFDYGGIVFYCLCIVLGLSLLSGIPMPDSGYAARVQQVAQIIKGSDYPVWSDNLNPLLIDGLQAYSEPFVFTNAENKGVWNDAKFVSDIMNERIEYFVMSQPLTSPNLTRIKQSEIDIIKENYTLVYNNDNQSGDPSYQLFVYEANRLVNG